MYSVVCINTIVEFQLNIVTNMYGAHHNTLPCQVHAHLLKLTNNISFHKYHDFLCVMLINL